MADPRPALNPTTHSVGFTAKLVTVRSVSADGKSAVCVDRQNVQVTVPMLVQRSKGPLPAPGETWLLTQDLGMWVFAAIVATSSGQFLGSEGATPGGTRVTISAGPPVSPATGDVWVSAASGNAVFWWTGTSWMSAQFGTQAIADRAITRQKLAPGAITTSEIAQGAGITASQVAFSATDIGGVRIFKGTSQPPNPAQGDLWINPDQGNALYFWDNGRWTGLLLGAGAIAPGSLTTFQISPDAGIKDGQVDFTARDIGGITTSVSSAQPANPSTGDLWFDGTSSYALKQWNGSAWVLYQFGTQAIQAASVTAALIAAHTITAAQIAAGTITATEIAAGIVIAGIVDGTLILGSQFVVHGTSSGLFEYAGTPGLGTPPVIWLTEAATDPYGNSIPFTGLGAYDGSFVSRFQGGVVEVGEVPNYANGKFFSSGTSTWLASWTASALDKPEQLGLTSAANSGLGVPAALLTAQGGGYFQCLVPSGLTGASAGVTFVSPSGDTTGATDKAVINAVLAGTASTPPSWCVLTPGTYYVNGPISVPQHGILCGPPIARKSTYGAVIKPVAGFSGGSGVIVLATGGDGFVVDGIAIDGSSYVAGTLHGIYATGTAHSAVIRHCGIKSMTGDGIHTDRSSGNVPFSWQVEDVESSNHTGHGYWTTDMTDTSWVSCRAVSNGGNGWTTNPSDAPGSNSRFIECISETNSGYGWNLQGNGSTFAILFSGCSTQSNAKSGLYIATSAAVSAFIQVTGCRFWEDGTAGGGGTNYAGIEVAGTTGPTGLMISGTSIQTQNTGSPSHPQYGLSITNCSGHCRVSGSLLIGGTSAYNNGGGNTSVVIDTTTGQATGSLSGLTWSVA